MFYLLDSIIPYLHFFTQHYIPPLNIWSLVWHVLKPETKQARPMKAKQASLSFIQAKRSTIQEH